MKILVEPHEAYCDKYGRSAACTSQNEMLRDADALIAFWDRYSTVTKRLIDVAQSKGLKVAIVCYDRDTR